MKKIIFSILSVMALAACVKEDLPQPIEPQQEGDMVRVTFGVKVPESGSATRVMGNEAINSLHLIVFDEQGYFTYKAPATLEGSGVPNDPTTRQFSVELPNSSAKRIIHFVANVSAQFDAINSGHEDGVMSSLYVTGDADAYWQRMEYNGGIANNASTADFDKNAIIPLVRNYAKINVTAAANSGFTLKGFKVFNTYSQGSVAAYDGEFVEFVEMNTATDSEGRMFTPYTYAEMSSYGCNEMGELNTAGIGDYASTAAAYVRETPSDATPYIIIYGTYSGDGKDYYYKLAFDGKHIYRNFEYIFNITSVTKAGYDEAGAKNSKAEGAGISWAEDTKSLLSLSDGKSQLYVSATTIVMVDNTRTYELKYKYVPDITTGTADNDEVNISWEQEDNEVISDLAYTATAIDSEGYTTITITPATTMPTFLKDTKITIDDGKNLARQVTVYLMPAYDMTVTAYDGNVGTSDKEVAFSVGEKVWVDVAIPSDVQPALFPLEFVFETAAQSLYPDATVDGQNMPVRTGQSIINEDKTSFGFVYTLDSLTYKNLPINDGKKTFTAKFLTNKAASESTVYVYNEYFDLGDDDFTNGGTSTGGGNTGDDSGDDDNTGTAVTTLKIGNITSAEGSGLSDRNRNVTIYTASGASLGTRTFGTGGPTDKSDLSVPSNITLNSSDYIYFQYSRSSSGPYYAYVKVSDLNSGKVTSLTFTTTNPL